MNKTVTINLAGLVFHIVNAADNAENLVVKNAAAATKGTINQDEEGIFVCDGSVMPGPTGANPSLTIAAMSNRFADRIIEKRGRRAATDSVQAMKVVGPEGEVSARPVEG